MVPSESPKHGANKSQFSFIPSRRLGLLHPPPDHKAGHAVVQQKHMLVLEKLFQSFQLHKSVTGTVTSLSNSLKFNAL